MINQFKNNLCTDVPLPTEKLERDVCELPSLTRNSHYLELNFLSLDHNFTKIYPDNSNSGSCDSTRMLFQALARGCTISKKNCVMRHRFILICAFYHNKCMIMSPLSMK